MKAKALLKGALNNIKNGSKIIIDKTIKPYLKEKAALKKIENEAYTEESKKQAKKRGIEKARKGRLGSLGIDIKAPAISMRGFTPPSLTPNQNKKQEGDGKT